MSSSDVAAPEAPAPGARSSRPLPRPEPWPEADLERVTRCPVCGGEDRHLLYRGLTDRVFGVAAGCWDLYQCRSGVAYLDPRPTASSIGRAYSTYYTHGDGAALTSVSFGTAPRGPLQYVRHMARNAYLNRRFGYRLRPSAGPLAALATGMIPVTKSLAERFIRAMPARPGERLLDIGCGGGDFVGRMRDLGWAAEGIEPDDRAAASARAAGLTVRTGTLEDDSYPPDSFAAITLSHVIEHVHEPRQLLERCLRILQPGGLLWVATPNLHGPGHRRFGRDWLHLDPPRHVVLFTPGSLRRLLAEVGFEPLADPAESVRAQASYGPSERISRGALAFDGETGVPRGLKLRAALLDALPSRAQGSREEIVLLVRKPG